MKKWGLYYYFGILFNESIEKKVNIIWLLGRRDNQLRNFSHLQIQAYWLVDTSNDGSSRKKVLVHLGVEPGSTL